MPCAEHAAKRERARELRRQGWSRAQIGREVGVRNSGTLTYWLKDIPIPEWTRRPRAKDDQRWLAVKMRLQGRSYRQIQDLLRVSKSSLSLWLRDVPLTDEQRRVLDQRRLSTGARRAATLKARRIAMTQRIVTEAAAQVGKVSQRELFIVGVIAYWAEGSKAKPWSPSKSVTFCNSDPSMIRLFLSWLELLGVAPSDLVVRLQIHERADVTGAERFWSEVTGVPADLFAHTTLKRHNPKTVRKNVGPRYVGCLTITVRKSTELNRRISGWYEGIVNSVGRRPIGRPLDLGSSNGRSSRPAPATNESTLFEASPPYICQRG